MGTLNPRLWQRLRRAAEEEVEAVLRTLPAPLRQRARNIPVTFETLPGDDLVQDGIADDTMGLFVGGDYVAVLEDPIPAQIILFLENIWEYADRETDVYLDEVRRTLLHELGHYLGLDEDELGERDLD